MNQPTYIFSTQTDWGVDSQNDTEISVQLKTEMESSRQRGDFDAKISGSSSKTSLLSSPDKQSKKTCQRSKLYLGNANDGTAHQRGCEIVGRYLGGALAPVLDELHGSPSSLLPEIGQEFTFGRGK